MVMRIGVKRVSGEDYDCAGQLGKLYIQIIYIEALYFPPDLILVLVSIKLHSNQPTETDK
jgi:hypothetical protein